MPLLAYILMDFFISVLDLQDHSDTEFPPLFDHLWPGWVAQQHDLGPLRVCVQELADAFSEYVWSNTLILAHMRINALSFVCLEIIVLGNLGVDLGIPLISSNRLPVDLRKIPQLLLSFCPVAIPLQHVLLVAFEIRSDGVVLLDKLSLEIFNLFGFAWCVVYHS